MAFWCRIRQAKLIRFSNQYKRSHFYHILNHTTTHPITRVLERPTTSIIHKTQIEFGNNVRFFAAPVQAKPKQEEKDTSGPRLNEKITAEYVRLVTEEGHAVVSRREALERARRLNLDLVEVDRNAKPPVCKIADYHKDKYEKQIKEKDRAKSKSEVTLRKGVCKEVRFSVKTEQKDLEMKANTIKRLMDRGYRVKCMTMGTEDQDLGGMLSRLSALIEDVSIVESGPRVEKRQAYVIVRHVKFGPSKKGSGKKLSNIVRDTSTSPLNPDVLNQSSIQSEDILDHDSGFESDGEILSEEAETLIPDKKNATWSTIDGNDDFDSVFDVGVETKTGKHYGDALSAPNSFSDVNRRPGVDSPKSMDSKGTSFGIFSAPKVNDTPETNGQPVEVNNRYAKRNAFDPRRHPRPQGVSENPNTTLPNTNRGGSGVDNGGQGQWGIFSRESSNGVPSRNSESYPKVRR